MQFLIDKHNLCSTNNMPTEFAIISFEDRSIRPLINAYPWFSAGNYGVDCEFKGDNKVDLLIHYIGLSSK